MLITGTSRGIGRYLAEYYASNNFLVIGCSRSASTLTHKNYQHLIEDISNEKSILNIFSIIRKQYKNLDVLINNAGINPAILSAALLPYSLIKNVYEVNTIAPMIFCREAVKIMLKKKSGRIINIGTMATKHEVPGEALYTSSKAALIAYSRVLAKETAKAGITVNIVAPSVIETDLSEKIDKEALSEVLKRNAIHGYGIMSDVSNAIDILLKSESNAITGQLIYLGGV